MLIIRDNFARDGRMLATAAALFSFCVTGSVVRAADVSDPGADASATATPSAQGANVKGTSQSQLPTVVVTGTASALSQASAYDGHRVRETSGTTGLLRVRILRWNESLLRSDFEPRTSKHPE